MSKLNVALALGGSTVPRAQAPAAPATVTAGLDVEALWASVPASAKSVRSGVRYLAVDGALVTLEDHAAKVRAASLVAVAAGQAFDTWLDTFVDEKGIDREETFDVEGPSGTNTMPYEVILEHMKIAPAQEQAKLKDKLIYLDFKNADIKHFLRYLGQAIAASKVRAADKEDKLGALADALVADGFMGVEFEYPGFLTLWRVPGMPAGYTIVATPWFNSESELDLGLVDPRGEYVDTPDLASVPFPGEDAPVDEQVAAYKAAVEKAAPDLVKLADADANRGSGPVAALKARMLAGGRYKSDEDIAKEFEGAKVQSLEFKPGKGSGWITVEFPNPGESVGGGQEEGTAAEVSTGFIIYDHSGKIAFDDWFPQETYDFLVKYIQEHKDSAPVQVQAAAKPVAADPKAIPPIKEKQPDPRLKRGQTEDDHYGDLLKPGKRPAVVVLNKVGTDGKIFQSKNVSMADLQKRAAEFSLAQWCETMPDATRLAKVLEENRQDLLPQPDTWPATKSPQALDPKQIRELPTPEEKVARLRRSDVTGSVEGSGVTPEDLGGGKGEIVDKMRSFDDKHDNPDRRPLYTWVFTWNDPDRPPTRGEMTDSREGAQVALDHFLRTGIINKRDGSTYHLEAGRVTRLRRSDVVSALARARDLVASGEEVLTFSHVDPDTGNMVYRGLDGKAYVAVGGVIHDTTESGEPLAPAPHAKVGKGEPSYDPADRFGRRDELKKLERERGSGVRGGISAGSPPWYEEVANGNPSVGVLNRGPIGRQSDRLMQVFEQAVRAVQARHESDGGPWSRDLLEKHKAEIAKQLLKRVKPGVDPRCYLVLQDENYHFLNDLLESLNLFGKPEPGTADDGVVTEKDMRDMADRGDAALRSGPKITPVLRVNSSEEPVEEEPEESGPDEDDITIGEDDLSAYCSGKQIVEVSREEADEDPDALYKAIAAWMEGHKYWPAVWWVSDHGNPNDVTAEVSKFQTRKARNKTPQGMGSMTPKDKETGAFKKGDPKDWVAGARVHGARGWRGVVLASPDRDGYCLVRQGLSKSAHRIHAFLLSLDPQADIRTVMAAHAGPALSAGLMTRAFGEQEEPCESCGADPAKTGAKTQYWSAKDRYLCPGCMKKENPEAKVEVVKAGAHAVSYKGYTIEPSGNNFYVKGPDGHRAFAEVPASVETAKKWIDMDVNERNAGKARGVSAAAPYRAPAMPKGPKFDKETGFMPREAMYGQDGPPKVTRRNGSPAVGFPPVRRVAGGKAAAPAEKARFTWDQEDQAFDGYDLTPLLGDMNGFDQPGFERAEADKIMALTVKNRSEAGESGYRMEFDKGLDMFIETDPKYNGEEDYPIGVPVDVETVDGPKHLYVMGGGGWTWSRVDGDVDQAVKAAMESTAPDAEALRGALTWPVADTDLGSAKKWLHSAIDFMGAGWHPDDSAEEMVNLGTDEPTMSAGEAKQFNRLLDRCHEAFDLAGEDIYAWGLDHPTFRENPLFEGLD